MTAAGEFTSRCRAAWWAIRSLERTRRSLRRRGLERTIVTPPPTLPDEALRGVNAVLRRRSYSCLERSLVLQVWHAAHGRPMDVVIGVTPPGANFGAHAWLDGEPDPYAGRVRELKRVPAG